jgi:uncharacterized membrane protein
MNIENWISYVSSRKAKTFWIGLLLMVSTALFMRPSSKCLTTLSTPKAIVDLELAFDQQEALRIKEVWSVNDCRNSLALSSNGLEAAMVNIVLDFPFLVAYTIFLIILIILTRRNDLLKDSITGFLIYAAFLAGLLDVIENILMMFFLGMHQIPSFTFAIAASLKFGIILLLIIAIFWRLVRLLILSKG